MLPRDVTEESPAREIHTPVSAMGHTGHPDYFIKMQRAMHEQLPDLWMTIAKTRKLHAGSPRKSVQGIRWFRCPTRTMRALSSVPSHHLQTMAENITDYSGNKIYPQPDGTYTMFHMVPTMNLVSAHARAPDSMGILADAGMRYGSRHGDGIGVYAYAAPPYELFLLGDQWCMVELKVRAFLTRVKSRSQGRYVLKSDQSDDSVGAQCTDCQVMAVLHMYSSLPEFMKF